MSNSSNNKVGDTKILPGTTSANVENVNEATASQVEDGNNSEILLATSIPYGEPVELLLVNKVPNDSTSRVFVVYNTRQDEGEEFTNLDDAVAEFVLDSICEFESVLRCGLQEGGFYRLAEYGSFGGKGAILLGKLTKFMSILDDVYKLGIVERLKDDLSTLDPKPSDNESATAILMEVAEVLVRHKSMLALG